MNNINILAKKLLIYIKSLFKSSVSILHNINSSPRDILYSKLQRDFINFLSIIFNIILKRLNFLKKELANIA